MKQSRLFAAVLCLLLLLMQQAVALHDLDHGMASFHHAGQSVTVNAINDLGNNSDDNGSVCKTCLGLSHISHLVFESPQAISVTPFLFNGLVSRIILYLGYLSFQPSSRDPPSVC